MFVVVLGLVCSFRFFRNSKSPWTFFANYYPWRFPSEPKTRHTYFICWKFICDTHTHTSSFDVAATSIFVIFFFYSVPIFFLFLLLFIVMNFAHTECSMLLAAFLLLFFFLSFLSFRIELDFCSKTVKCMKKKKCYTIKAKSSSKTLEFIIFDDSSKIKRNEQTKCCLHGYFCCLCVKDKLVRLSC